MYNVKERPNKYIMELLFTPQIIDKASLSICAYFCSVLVSVLEAKAMGRSIPSFITWDSTAPIPTGVTGDASQASLSGRMGS